MKTGQFEWADRTAVDAALWQSGQPSVFGLRVETCAFLDGKKGGKLRDFPCDQKNFSFICEPAEQDLHCF